MTKVLYISDLDQVGSGYMNIAIYLCAGLAEKGYDVKALGIFYKGDEHFHPFSIIPSKSMPDMYAQTDNLVKLWEPDVIVHGMDVTYQAKFLNFLQIRKIEVPVVGIFPLESLPLTMSWASTLAILDKQLVISQFGADECVRFGMEKAEHIPIGLDREIWKKPTPEEREAFRTNMGYEENDFVILTVAANQERKNLSAAMEIVKGVSNKIKDTKNIKFVLVTMEHLEVGWKLRDYWAELTMEQPYGELQIYERGIPVNELWMLYASADAFLLTSKAEGLGMPTLEAMGTQLPVFGTDCSAIREHLRTHEECPLGIKVSLINNKGYPLPVEFIHRDVWQNAKRYFVDVEKSVDTMSNYILGFYEVSDQIADRAEEYIVERTWDKAVDVLDSGIQEVLSERLQQDQPISE